MATGEIETIIGASSTMNGDLKFSGQLRLEGTVEGSVISSGDDGAQLVIGSGGRVKGDVNVPTVVNGGSVDGSLTASKSLSVLGSGAVKGSASYGSLEVTAGGRIDGELRPLSSGGGAGIVSKRPDK